LKLSSADIDITERTSDVHKIMKRLIADKHILFEKMLITKDGRKIPVETNAHLFNFNGKPAVLSILRDITDRKRMEEEILKTRKIESLGTLAGGIAHDFNNILTAILGNISLAKMFINPEDKPFKRLSEAERASLRAKDLTRQLLTFTKGGEPVKKTASISELLKESAGFALRGSNCRCEFFIPDNLFPVEMDKGQISQVVNNLVINAKEAMQEGGTIEVLAQNIEEEAKQAVPIPEGKYVKVSIKDYGIGIHEEHISKIFDPYFTTKEKGSGLGLATSYSIIRKHGGHITVESKIGVGTTFTFYLPASRKGVTTKEAIKEAPILGKGMVLVMDDEEMIRDLSVSMLTKLGYEVEVVKDGVEAVESYRKAKESGHPFDVVIMDLTIPGSMGGKEAIKKLLEADSNIKAIVSSGYSNDPIMADYRGYGFSGVIAKPYRIEEISDILNKVMCGCE
jgi:signal transduction histidine kinase/ActR/RegA family two-component response regulator